MTIFPNTWRTAWPTSASLGENVDLRKEYKQVHIIEKLGFGKCRLSVAVKRNETYDSVSFPNIRKKIATTYPVLVSAFLEKNKIQRGNP